MKTKRVQKFITTWQPLEASALYHRNGILMQRHRKICPTIYIPSVQFPSPLGSLEFILSVQKWPLRSSRD